MSWHTGGVIAFGHPGILEQIAFYIFERRIKHCVVVQVDSSDHIEPPDASHCYIRVADVAAVTIILQIWLFRNPRAAAVWMRVLAAVQPVKKLLFIGTVRQNPKGQRGEVAVIIDEIPLATIRVLLCDKVIRAVP